jgi:CheY-like chemotaxis protein
MIKVLIADDEPHILLLTTILFKECGFNVITAQNGQEAIDKALSEKPDLLISDILMPIKNGLEVCKFIRNSAEIGHIPILLLSALGDEYNKISGFEEGADDYITKPFDKNDLKERALSLLQRYQPQLTASFNVQEPTFASIASGFSVLDNSLSKGIPTGSNILVLGDIGAGKSTFARNFLLSGINNNEKCLFICLDDDLFKIKKYFSQILNLNISTLEQENMLRFVDGFTAAATPDTTHSSSANIDLHLLNNMIADASFDLGQTIQNKQGGRRVFDSISSLFLSSNLNQVQRFLNNIMRTAVPFGNVTTIFILESNTVSVSALNNIKYLMDGIFEFAVIDNKRAFRIISMKWSKYTSDWQYY